MKNTNNGIKPLMGPERVRKRPSLIFGDDGVDGAVEAIRYLLDIFTAEAERGHCSKIDVNIYKDNSIGIRSDSAFAIDETIVDGKPAWYYDFCELYRSPRDSKNNDGYNFSLGVDDMFYLCCTQYASAFFHVEEIHDGEKKILDFEKGFSVSGLVKEKTQEKLSSTYFHILLDSEVFTDIVVPSNVLNHILQEIAITIPGLRCSLYDANDGEGKAYEFYYPRGVQDYVLQITDSLPPLFVNEIEATGKDRYNKGEYDACVKMVFSFVEDLSRVECFHNHRILRFGGHHLEAIKEKLVSNINWVFLGDFYNDDVMEPEERYETRKSLEFTYDELSKNIVLILESSCSKGASRYVNATKQALANKMITDMASDLISDDFRFYLKSNHDVILEILKGIVKRRCSIALSI